MSKKQFTSVKTAEDFAFMCSMKRSLKSHPVFAGGGEGILVLVAPESHSPVRYGPALLDQLFPDDDFRRDDRGFMYLLKSDKLSKTLDTFRDECSKKRRAIVIVEHGAIIPAEIKVGADVITDIPPITPRDLQIACRIVLGIRVSPEEAKRAVSYPEQLLWSALRPGRSMSSVLDRLASAGSDQESVVTHRPSREIPALENMFGYGEAKSWGMQLAQDLEDWRNGVIDWDDVDRGIVLSGAPGVGKNHLRAGRGEAMRRETDRNIPRPVAITGSPWGFVEGHESGLRIRKGSRAIHPVRGRAGFHRRPAEIQTRQR